LGKKGEVHRKSLEVHRGKREGGGGEPRFPSDLEMFFRETKKGEETQDNPCRKETTQRTVRWGGKFRSFQKGGVSWKGSRYALNGKKKKRIPHM